MRATDLFNRDMDAFEELPFAGLNPEEQTECVDSDERTRRL
jgi:hypothetical protein